MKKIIGTLIVLVVLTTQSLAAGYSIITSSDTNKFMESVDKNNKKYSEIYSDETNDGFRTYIYRLDFQIIAQVGGHGHIATITGLESDSTGVQKKIVEAKREILSKESSFAYVRGGDKKI